MAFIIASPQKYKILSRTETKEQSGGGREFSAMNATGIISCKATEDLSKRALSMVPIDKMISPHAEEDLVDMVTLWGSHRTLFMAADNSRFGPNQVMAKSRVVALALSLREGRHHDRI
jgi:hypothetical protein